MYGLRRTLLPMLFLVPVAAIALALSSPAQEVRRTAGFINPTMQARARFEVSITRVLVNQQSLENAVEFAGAGDEVRFSRVSMLHNVRTGTRVLSDGLNFTETFGEQPPNPIRLGNASPRGGLKSRDDITLPTPIPVFSAELVHGETAATIIVSVWEMDGPTDLYEHYKNFLNTYREDMQRIALGTFRNSPESAPVIRVWDNSFTGNDPVGTPNTATVVTLGDGPLGLGEAKDRPIGMIRLGNRYNFTPKLMILNYDNADRAAQTNEGNGLGVIKINYQDDQRLRGDYTLFVRIRRV